MKKSTTRKLALRPETLKTLQSSALKVVVGGITSPCPIGTAQTNCESRAVSECTTC